MMEGSDPAAILREIQSLARANHVPVRLVSQRQIQQVQGSEAPQGVIAFAEPLTEADLSDLVGLRSDDVGATSPVDRMDDERSRPEDAEPGDAEPEDAEPGDAEPEDAEPEDAEPEDAEPEDAEPADAEPEDAEPGDAEPADAEPGDAEPGDAEPEDAEPEAPVESARHVKVGQGSKTGKMAFLVVVDGVTDPQNLGALLRSAECAGVTGVVLPRHRSAHVTPTVTKVAAGAIEHVSVAVVPGVPGALQELERLGVWTVGLDERGSEPVFNLQLGDRPIALVIGAEGRGLAPLTRQRCDVLARIPLHGSIDSLNVSAAGAVAMFEVARQRSAESG
jgi:predicted rRNA methylase